jgi:uncharacterized protein YndB with AHSA1/START domain
LGSHTTELTLHLECVLDAPRSLVFDACTEPKLLAEWWGPKGFTTPGIDIDLRVGGRYRIAMQPPEDELFYLTGEFREVDPPNSLAYTFRWEDPDPDDQETVVTISLRDAGESTELTVDQGAFATEARRDLHQAGWTDGLVRLEDALRSRAVE